MGDLYDFKDGSTSLYVFLIPVGIVSTVIACLSCTWGFRLANTRYFTVPITQFQTGAIATVASPAQRQLTHHQGKVSQWALQQLLCNSKITTPRPCQHSRKRGVNIVFSLNRWIPPLQIKNQSR